MSQPVLDALARIEDRLEKIEAKLDQLMPSVARMDNHISFVDGVYATVKTPFMGMMRLASRYTADTAAIE